LQEREIDVIAERESILALLDASHGIMDWKMRGMILMGVGSGMRLGEMRGLRWKNIKHPGTAPELRTIRIVESWPVNGNEGELPKTGRSRSVLYPRLLGDWFHKNRHRGTMEELVYGKTDSADLLQMLTRRCYRAGFSVAANFQSLRHTFASQLLTYGYPLEWVADQLGNTPEVARRHYAKHIDPWRRPTTVPEGMNPTDIIFTGGE
jgi:integrase